MKKHTWAQILNYFHEFAVKHNITEEYINKAVERIRHPKETNKETEHGEQ